MRVAGVKSCVGTKFDKLEIYKIMGGDLFD